MTSSLANLPPALLAQIFVTLGEKVLTCAVASETNKANQSSSVVQQKAMYFIVKFPINVFKSQLFVFPHVVDGPSYLCACGVIIAVS
jgi:hypothetical protein